MWPTPKQNFLAFDSDWNSIHESGFIGALQRVVYKTSAHSQTRFKLNDHVGSDESLFMAYSI